MKEYRIVCDRVTTFRNGKTEVEEGALPIDERGRLESLTFDTIENAEYWLTRAKEYYSKRTNWGPDKVRQYNFRFQCREVSPWEDV